MLPSHIPSLSSKCSVASTRQSVGSAMSQSPKRHSRSLSRSFRSARREISSLRFIRKIFTWDPAARAGPHELFMDEWFVGRKRMSQRERKLAQQMAETERARGLGRPTEHTDLRLIPCSAVLISGYLQLSCKFSSGTTGTRRITMSAADNVGAIPTMARRGAVPSQMDDQWRVLHSNQGPLRVDCERGIVRNTLFLLSVANRLASGKSINLELSVLAHR